MRKNILLVGFLVLLASCSSARSREVILSGVLQIGVDQHQFLSLWGTPDSTKTITGENQAEGSIGRYGGGFTSGKRTLEVWTYNNIKTELYFSRNKKGKATLAGWDSKSTVDELKEYARTHKEQEVSN